MNAQFEVPTAIRICRRCESLASGPSCATCRAIQWDAIQFATDTFRLGALTFEIVPQPNPTPAQQYFAQVALSEFHRLRTARLHSALPTVRNGLTGMPLFRSGTHRMARRMFWPLAFLAALTCLFLLLYGFGGL